MRELHCFFINRAFGLSLLTQLRGLVESKLRVCEENTHLHEMAQPPTYFLRATLEKAFKDLLPLEM